MISPRKDGGRGLSRPPGSLTRCGDFDVLRLPFLTVLDRMGSDALLPPAELLLMLKDVRSDPMFDILSSDCDRLR